MKEFVKNSCLNHEAFSSLAECGPILNTLCSRPCRSPRGTGTQQKAGQVCTRVGDGRGRPGPGLPTGSLLRLWGPSNGGSSSGP